MTTKRNIVFFEMRVLEFCNRVLSIKSPILRETGYDIVFSAPFAAKLTVQEGPKRKMRLLPRDTEGNNHAHCSLPYRLSRFVVPPGKRKYIPGQF